MASLARPRFRDSRRRPVPAPHHVEILENRTLLSGTGAGLFGSQATPQPLHVPTVITLQSAASSAETGQALPLVATVSAAGTARQMKAAKSATITGTIEFLTDSPRPMILGKVAINKSNSQGPLSIVSAIDSFFGVSNQQAAFSENDTAFLRTTALRQLGSYQIEARFLAANDEFRASASAPATVTITPRTQDAPTVTALQAPTSAIETGETLAPSVTVQDPGNGLAGGVVKLTTVAPHPVVLGKVSVGVFNQPLSISTDQLQAVGTYQVQAVYQPDSNRFAASTSAPVTVTVTPLTAASFRVTPVVPHGHLGQPMSFKVTALDVHGQPLTNYTGTVDFSSPTDSWTILSPAAYHSLGIVQPSPDSPGLATFNPASYTFTPADRGSHTFTGAVTFGKAGAETLEVSQADDPEVRGETTFAIG
jgi:Bacterial Ig-like domain (group 3)